ncbi:general secretion pathway protein C [Ramlibacter sp. USB13]|uniref:General secretion pathway protein C n=1 Tax=Ramlibacter cellulosilyticus TaxID=2764187 RepID=A0A923MWJ3_9BURK|nr:type II secretion system protein N [Ramlibacter cellulosilyticus]MBC5785047.1 general secretion pathway protein C [Ramlibacter cellulosilyticus]
MWTPTPAWTVRGATFALWALAAASAVAWGLKLGGQSAPRTVPPAPLRAPAAVDPVALASLLGSAPAAAAATVAAPTLASRFHLVGVAAGAASGAGAAVISVDGKPARPYRVGSSIEEGVVLQSVRGRQAVLASSAGQPLATLELPPPPAPATGQSPIAVPR